MDKLTIGISKTGNSLNVDTLLVLEKVFEATGQQWVENLNILEQVLVRIVENLGGASTSSRANFIIRRLPTYTASFVNKNEYAIILEEIGFTLTSPHPTDRESLYDIHEGTGKIPLGQVEIFPTQETQDANGGVSGDICSGQALNGADIFTTFAAAFQKAFVEEVEKTGESQESPNEKVQLLAPHLLHPLKCHVDVQKIFTLTQPGIPLSKARKSKCQLTVDPVNLILTLQLEESIILVRPSLFLKEGYGRLNNALLERIPLFHPAVIWIGESMTKGCLISPSTLDSQWTIQFWPCESHIISIFHPNSIIGRIFKLYGSFCLAPLTFWECLNESFIAGVEGLVAPPASENSHFNLDFLIHSFLFELEKFPNIEDWGPSNFTIRFMSLVKLAVDSYEKGFYPHYFTKNNLLKGLWREVGGGGGETCDTAGTAATAATTTTNGGKLENIEENTTDYGDYEQERYKEHYPSDLDELEDDFGFQLDRLSVQEEREIRMGNTVNPFSGLSSGRSSFDTCGPAAAARKPKSLSRKLGANILRRFSTLNKSRSRDSAAGDGGRPKSMTDIATGFEEMVNQMRREETLGQRHLPPESDEALGAGISETSFSKVKKRSSSVSSFVQQLVDPNANAHPRHSTSVAFDNAAFLQSKESIYSTISIFLNEISVCEHYSDPEMILHLDKSKKVLYSQGELITIWNQIMEEGRKPKYTCPHAFSLRQIQYISLVIKTLSSCSPNILFSQSGSSNNARMPSWEISGDILRTVLYQLRSEVLFHDSLKMKKKGPLPRKFSLKSSKSFSEGSNRNSRAGLVSKFSFRRGGNDICKDHGSSESEADAENNTQMALEDPETAATHRLLQWLWQLRNSEIGRLSSKAQKYIEALHSSSHVNSHFLEQFAEQKIVKSTAIRSAVAVSRIMADKSFRPHVPLLAASKKGWLWAEMVLSLVSWNQEKGIVMNAEVPAVQEDGVQKYLIREIQMVSTVGSDSGTLGKAKKTEPDTEAVTLAFHSELATPLGWNDFEDPRRPGPQTVSILIFSSFGYFNRWEMISGNIVQTMVRLQKFNNLQHVGSLLYPPHRKTALNEVRKLNKSVSFRTFHFDDNVMTKTFRRLASLRNTRGFFAASGRYQPERAVFYTCEQMGCTPLAGETITTALNGKEVECTRF